MSRCCWDERQHRWAVEHIECAGNLVRARREAEASMSGGSEASSSDGSSGGFADAEETLGQVLHGGSGGRLADILFGSAKGGRRPSAVGLAGRPRTAAMQHRQSLTRPEHPPAAAARV